MAGAERYPVGFFHQDRSGEDYRLVHHMSDYGKS